MATNAKVTTFTDEDIKKSEKGSTLKPITVSVAKKKKATATEDSNLETTDIKIEKKEKEEKEMKAKETKATEAKKTTAKKAAKKTTTKAAKAAEVKEEVNAEVKEEVKAEVKEETKKAPAKKTAAKKTAAKETAAKETAAKATKTTAKKTTATKTTTKKAAKNIEESVYIQFYNKEIVTANVIENIKNVYVERFNKKLSDIKSLDVYIKPEENKAYFVINGESHPDYNIEL